MTTYQEVAVPFDCQGVPLQGVASLPLEGAGASASRTGVVIVVGGPQYRAGSHRQFVLLARALASSGTPVLRFDYRGMGDSAGEPVDFERANDDIGCAISALKTAAPGVEAVVLWGLCDGASAALMYCHATQDARVRGLCLLNPWVRSEASLATTQVKHYYTQRLRQKEFWLKLLSGKVAAGAVAGLLGSVRRALGGAGLSQPGGGNPPFQLRMARAWHRFGGPILLILSGEDYTAKEFLEQLRAEPAWADALSKAGVTRYDCHKADHTFSNSASRSAVEESTARWLSDNALQLGR